jgi:PAS domain S-box-containing protein
MEQRKEFRHRDTVFKREDGSRLYFRTAGWPVFDAAGVFEGFRGTGINVTANRELENALALGEDRFRSAFESITIGSVVIDAAGIVEAFNAAAENIFGYTADEVVGKNVKILMPEIFSKSHDSFLQRYLDTGNAKIINIGREVAGLRKSGEEFPMHLGVGELFIGKRKSFIGSVTDLSEMKILEKQFFRAQRMQTIGVLAGGMAHDFNNLMGAMLGNAELLIGNVGGDEKALLRIERIKTAVRRGISLTDRLLAFSRQQVELPRATNIARLLSGLDDMLRRTLGETIELKYVISSHLWMSVIDPSQLEHALINLAVNARDAMPKGGILTIEVDNAIVDDITAIRWEYLTPGDFIKISVIDNGAGMTRRVLENAFEPFYTTKDVGKGSGLGLSMVQGFVKQSKGHVSIHSEADKGTTVSMYIPRSQEAAIEHAEQEMPVISGGSERILIVEDDEIVREIPVSYLRQQGYEIVEAANGQEAIRCLRELGPFNLLFTDIVLPGGMNGVEIAKEAKRLLPDIKILYTTGYADTVVVENDLFNDEKSFIRKPYEFKDLVEIVRSILDDGQV